MPGLSSEKGAHMSDVTALFSRASLLTPLVALLLAGPLMAQECLECHGTLVTARADIAGQMGSVSHHVQGTAVSGRHCYACHWEATEAGEIDRRYHTGSAGTGGAVDLVLWSAGKRPTVYRPLSSAVTFRAGAIGSDSERDELAKISNHCLGCHGDSNNDTRPFAGDSNTPRRYAWDGLSIAARYTNRGSATWGKYSTASSNKKMRITKAFSAHGNAAANQGGWSQAGGYDAEMPLTRGGAGARNVECYDCHNSHGSDVAGVTSSYPSLAGGLNGAILKRTRTGQGGYRMDYHPDANLDGNSPNPYNAGADLCFDCHEAAMSATTPWGYRQTFGASQPVLGYKDTSRFGQGLKGSTARYAGRQGRSEIAASHLKAGKLLNYSSQGSINGLCTPCHDPHGISPTLAGDMPYALPLLKGTWLTSPYREDAPPATLPTRGSYAGKAPNMAISWDKGNLKGEGKTDKNQAPLSYNIDRNTFGEGGRIVEDDQRFGGLCLKCHRKENLTNRNDTIHRAVKGWGANTEHAFPCSKCHQAHNSGLPRLMQTNCLEAGPAGLRDSGAAPWFAAKKESGNRIISQSSAVPAAKKSVKEAVVGCHVRRAGNRAGGPPDSSSGEWNKVNPW